MLTKAEIVAAPPTLDDVDVQMWLSLIRADQYYRDNIALFPDLQSRIEDASGDTAGKMLNALSAKVQALGVGNVAIRGVPSSKAEGYGGAPTNEGLYYSQSEERSALVAYALYIVYEAPDVVISTTTGSFGNYQVRQRSFCNCGSLSHAVWCAMNRIL